MVNGYALAGVEMLSCLVVEMFAGEHPPLPPFEGGKSGAKGDVIPSKGGIYDVPNANKHKWRKSTQMKKSSKVVKGSQSSKE